MTMMSQLPTINNQEWGMMMKCGRRHNMSVAWYGEASDGCGFSFASLLTVALPAVPTALNGTFCFLSTPNQLGFISCGRSSGFGHHSAWVNWLLVRQREVMVSFGWRR